MMRLCWQVARQIGQWPQEVYEEMPLEWLWFGVGLNIREKAEQKKAMDRSRQSPGRRTMSGAKF